MMKNNFIYLDGCTAKRSIVSIIFYFLFFFFLSTFTVDVIVIKFLEAYFDKPVSDLANNIKAFGSASINLFAYIILFTALGVSHFDVLKDDFIDAKKSNRKYMLFFIWLGIFYAVEYGVGIISSLITPEQSENQNTIEEIFSYEPITKLFLFIAAAIIGPVVEEIIFRYSFFELIKNKYAAIIISSLVFGFIHMTTSFDLGLFKWIVLYIPYCISGATFALMYEKSNHNIWLPISVHMVSNALGLILILLV